MEYDFWYSKKMEACMIAHARREGKAYTETKWKCEKFTEQITSGEKPVSEAWGDLVKIGTGSDSDCMYKTTNH